MGGRGQGSGKAASAIQLYPLHVVLRCQQCGSAYHGQTNRDRRVSRHAVPDRGCPPPRTVLSDLLEEQLAVALRQVVIPSDWHSHITRLIRKPEVDTHTDERQRLQHRIERLRYQHLCGAIDDETFRREFRSLKTQLDRLPQPAPPLLDSYREPTKHLHTMGTILGHPSVHTRPDAMTQFQRFCELAFARISVDGRRLVSIQPRPRYAEHFALCLAKQNPAKPEPRGVGTCAVERTRPHSSPTGRA